MASLDQTLRTWFQSLAPRERMLVVVAGTLIGVAVIYSVLLAPLSRAVTTREARVERKQTDLAWMQSMTGSLQQLEAMRPRNATNESLVVIIDRSARQAGLATALTSQSPNGENGMRVRLENAQFDAVIEWLGQLHQQYGLDIDAASFDRTAKTGVINGSLTITRAAQ